MKRIEIESLRDGIKINYNVDNYDCDDYADELMRKLECDYITVEDFESLMSTHYENLENYELMEEE